MKKVWSTIDTDNSGFIEANELRTFLEKCLELKTSKEVPISKETLDDYTNSIVSKIIL
jgi:Ca2+-binding EF-hand superfamily protein